MKSNKFYVFLVFLLAMSLLIAYVVMNSKNKEIEGSWIVVKQISKPQSGLIHILDGLLINFDKKDIKLGRVGYDFEEEQIYSIENNNIKADSFFRGKILHLSKDNLIIEDDSTTFDMYLLPLKETKLDQAAKETLTKRLEEDLYQIPFYGVTHNLYMSYKKGRPAIDNNAKKMVPEVHYDNREYLNDAGWWAVKEFEGKLLLQLSMRLSDSKIIQITAINEEEIIGYFADEYNLEWKEIKLTKRESLSQSKKEELLSQLKGKWKMEKLLKPTLEDLKKAKEANDYTGVGVIEYESRVTINDLIEKDIIIEIEEEASITISSDKRIIRKSDRWTITQDGKYIILDHPIKKANFIKILSITDNEMFISKEEKINLKNTKRPEYYPVNLELKLRKE